MAVCASPLQWVSLTAWPLGAVFVLSFWACLSPHSAGADGGVLRFDRLFPSVRLGDRRDRLYLPTAVGVPDGVAAGCFYLFCLFTW